MYFVLLNIQAKLYRFQLQSCLCKCLEHNVKKYLTTYCGCPFQSFTTWSLKKCFLTSPLDLCLLAFILGTLSPCSSSTQHHHHIRNKPYVIAVYFSKTFDSVRHSTLLQQYVSLKLQDNIYNSTESYFQQHSYFTTFQVQFSNQEVVTASIVQGSSIGLPS